MDDDEKQKIWAFRNEIVKRCHQVIENLARRDYFFAVKDVLEIESITEAFYKDNAN